MPFIEGLLQTRTSLSWVLEGDSLFLGFLGGLACFGFFGFGFVWGVVCVFLMPQLRMLPLCKYTLKISFLRKLHIFCLS